MGKEVRYFILLVALVGSFCLGFSQDLSSPPPEPMMTTQETTTQPCGSGDGGIGGPGIPPPVGLCLPINNYLLPLLVSGVALGVFFIFRIERKQDSKIAAL